VVPFRDFPGHVIDGGAGFPGAALGANLRFGVQENFDLRVWKYDGSDISALHHH